MLEDGDAGFGERLDFRVHDFLIGVRLVEKFRPSVPIQTQCGILKFAPGVESGVERDLNDA